jgi:hypothetical protein
MDFAENYFFHERKVKIAIIFLPPNKEITENSFFHLLLIAILILILVFAHFCLFTDFFPFVDFVNPSNVAIKPMLQNDLFC